MSKIVKVPKGKTFRGLLEDLQACQPAIDWVGKKSLKTAWNTCQEPEWMWWLLDNVYFEISKETMFENAIFEASYDCVMAILQYANKNDFDALFELTERAVNYENYHKLIEVNVLTRPPLYTNVGFEVLEAVRCLLYIRQHPNPSRSMWMAEMISAFPEKTGLFHLKAGFADNIRRRIPYGMVKEGLGR